MLKILHLEDSPDDVELVERELQKTGIQYKKVVVDNEIDYRNALDGFLPNIVLSDHSLPSFDSIAALGILREKDLNIPFILVTSAMSEEFAVAIMKDGADDYLLKDRLSRLPKAIENAMDKWQAEKERQQYFEKIISSERMYKEAQQIAHLGDWQVDFITGKHCWSEELYKIFGTNKEETHPSQEAFLSFVHEEDLDFVKSKINEEINEFKNTAYDNRIVRKNGEIRYVYSESKFEFNEDGKPIRLHGISHDITERKIYIEAIEKQNKTLREITWTQSHVVRAPLARMLGSIELINEESVLKNPVELKNLLDNISASAKELDNVINGIIRKAERIAFNQLKTKINSNLMNKPIETLEPKNGKANAKLKVLLVDDDNFVMKMIKLLVIKKGLSDNPSSFENGQLAIDYLLANKDDNDYYLVFLDINMPVMDGWGFLDTLQSLPFANRVNVIMLTSSADGVDKERAAHYPQVIEYYEKPLKVDDCMKAKQLPAIAAFFE